MQKTMLAGVFERVGTFRIKEVPVPDIAHENDVLIRVDAAGICGTDVHILAEPPGFVATPNTILSHEYTGRIVSVGSKVSHVQEGDQVVVEPNIPCHHCIYCRMGLPNQCENMLTLGIHLDGGFAQYNVAPARMLHRISQDIPASVVALTEPLSCVLAGFESLEIQPGTTAVVLGAGPIGLLFVQMIKAAGAAKIIASEPTALRRAWARKVGASMVINPREVDLEEVVRAETGVGSDVVVDAVGSLFPDTLKCVRRGGTVLLFGINEEAVGEVKQYLIARYEIRIVGMFIGRHTFPRAVQILENRVIDAEKLITHTLPLSRILEGIELMRGGEGIKIIIDPWLRE